MLNAAHAKLRMAQQFPNSTKLIGGTSTYKADGTKVLPGIPLGELKGEYREEIAQLEAMEEEMGTAHL